MKKLLTFVLLLVAFSLQAQDNAEALPKIGTITGNVLDATLNQPLPYVNIIVKDTNNKLITGGITNDNGQFEVNQIPEGSNTVSIEYLGFLPQTKTIVISKDNRTIDLGTINLEEASTNLDEVTIVAETSTIQQKVDRKVITVGKDLTTSGPTASDIMNNLPSVSVDQQTGDISLRGNQNVRVMVDGKLSNIPAAQLLKQIPSTSIKSIELITNPSAKYNPEGMSGIINIILHKNVKIGFNGNINLGLAYQENAKFNSSIDMNYRNGKVNLYGNYGNNINKNQNYGNIFRPDDNSEQFFNFLDATENHLYKVGVDFYLNEKNTISVFTSQNSSDSSNEGPTNIVFYDDQSFNQTQLFFTDNSNISRQYNFDYKLDFAKEGHNIELEVDYNRFNQDEDADFRFRGFTQTQDYLDFVDTDRDLTTVNLDYINPLSDSSKLELGLQALLFDSKIDYSSTGFSANPNQDMTPNNGDEFIPTPSTDFDYTRDIFSAYATYGKELEKFTYQVGVRLENVKEQSDAVQLFADTTTEVIPFTNDYFQLYPSAFFTYSPTEKNSYQFSYSRRVDRPGVGQVNPIREWSTPLISSFGNQNLQPQFTNSFETNYTRQLEKGSITAGVFYRIIEDEINRAVFIDRNNLNRIILTFDNFNNNSSYGIELSSNYRPTKWWSFNGSFDLYSQTQNGITEVLNAPIETATADDIITQKLAVDNVAWNLRMFNNFKVTKTLSLSAFGFYRGQNKGIQFTMKPMYFVNLGARQSFADGKGSFSLNFNDVFDTMQFAFEGDNPFRQTGAFNWESRTIFAGLSYRFGGGNYRAKSRKQRDKNEAQGGGFL
ncbi:TonB-dependent receptor [Olleya sp. YS]|uniref:TonB-dependent receptor domain-containing protein n=1 Tax=Olleya sp. YS TaxID=3028318 RepID=UPI00243453C7|nr:TonB-dependent receptor [Olleya sp. YS]WGD34015.1 TonB-dependent receptor [Olleya sp. YS]